MELALWSRFQLTTSRFWQDFKAEKAIQSLFALSAPTCKVIRQGLTINIKAEELVRGDVVVLHVGDIVPADLRIISGLNLTTDVGSLSRSWRA